jgi:hypothetical protein
MKPIKTLFAGALILGSAIVTTNALAANDVVVTSNQPIPYRYDQPIGAQPMAGIDRMYPSTGGPAEVLNPSLVQRSDGLWEHRAAEQ